MGDMRQFTTCKDDLLAHLRDNPMTRATSAELTEKLPGWDRSAIDKALRDLENEGYVSRETESIADGTTPTKTYWHLIDA